MLMKEMEKMEKKMDFDAQLPLRRVLEKLNGKKVLIMGSGREGKATLEKLSELAPEAILTVSDMKEQTLPEGVRGVFGEGYQDHLTDYDMIIKSPGIVLTDRRPKVLERLTSQTELFLAAYRDQTVGITGTKGKSTTTSLIWHALQSVYPGTLLMGNIGIPAFCRRIRSGRIRRLSTSFPATSWNLPAFRPISRFCSTSLRIILTITER